NKNVQQMLWYMLQRDEVAVASPSGGSSGRDKLWDLAERVYGDTPLPDPDQALAERARRRLAALGIARPTGPIDPPEPTYVGEAGEPAVVDGVRGKWRVDPTYLEGDFAGRAALLSPFDRLVMDRKRLDALFEFDYVLEMYKPKAQRIWGYYALPVLYGDRLVGKLDATAERDEGVLRVDAVHEDEPFTSEMRDAVDAEIDDLATWSGLDVVRV
ncbi:MAG: crosslink repair DNA glycosylase YcaQ family protein, partial [Nocardioides sp.]